MKTIKFHFFDNPGIGGWLIKARLASPFTHAGVEFADGSFFDSTFSHGFAETPFHELGKTPKYTVEISVSESGYDAALLFCKENVGKAYDFKAIWGFFWITKNQDNDALFCSEVARMIFETATGVTVPYLTLCSPHELRIQVETYKNTKRLEL